MDQQGVIEYFAPDKLCTRTRTEGRGLRREKPFHTEGDKRGSIGRDQGGLSDMEGGGISHN